MSLSIGIGASTTRAAFFLILMGDGGASGASGVRLQSDAAKTMAASREACMASEAHDGCCCRAMTSHCDSCSHFQVCLHH